MSLELQGLQAVLGVEIFEKNHSGQINKEESQAAQNGEDRFRAGRRLDEPFSRSSGLSTRFEPVAGEFSFCPGTLSRRGAQSERGDM